MKTALEAKFAGTSYTTPTSSALRPGVMLKSCGSNKPSGQAQPAMEQEKQKKKRQNRGA